jgi:poly(3-hydroxybutyrate) depolymerase
MRMQNAPASDAAEQGRLHVPATGTTARIPVGRSAVHVDGQRVGLWYGPRTPAERLLLVLHGAGASAEDALGLVRAYADDHRLMVFAPQSAGRTWDMILPGTGPTWSGFKVL